MCPRWLAIYGYASIEEMWGVHAKMTADAEWERNSRPGKAGPEPAFESLDASLLEAAEYSPEIAATAG